MTTQLILHKTPYTPSSFQKKKIVLSIADAFRNIPFLPHFYLFSQRMWCAIFEINTSLLIINQTSIFLHKRLYIPPSFRKKNCALQRKRFSKHLLFATFYLFLKVGEVCNISSKCWLPNKSANKIFLQKTPDAAPAYQRKTCAPHRAKFLETSTFYYMTTSFHSGWGLQYFK